MLEHRSSCDTALNRHSGGIHIGMSPASLGLPAKLVVICLLSMPQKASEVQVQACNTAARSTRCNVSAQPRAEFSCLAGPCLRSPAPPQAPKMSTPAMAACALRALHTHHKIVKADKHSFGAKLGYRYGTLSESHCFACDHKIWQIHAQQTS